MMDVFSKIVLALAVLSQVDMGCGFGPFLQPFMYEGKIILSLSVWKYQISSYSRIHQRVVRTKQISQVGSWFCTVLNLTAENS